MKYYSFDKIQYLFETMDEIPVQLLGGITLSPELKIAG